MLLHHVIMDNRKADLTNRLKDTMKIERNPEIIWRIEKRREAEVIQALERGEDVAGHGTVILIVSGTMHQLNFVGGRIWALCDGSRSEEEIATLLSAEFEVAPEELAADLAEFVNDLVEREWLRRV